MKRIIWLSFALFPLLLWGQNPTIQAFKAEKLFQEGRQAYENNDFRAAIDIFDEVANMDPNHNMVYEMRAEAYFALGQYDKAIADYTRAIQQYPNNAELRNSRGVAAANLELYDAAISYFYEALQVDPNHEAAKGNLEKAEQVRQQLGLAVGESGSRPNWSTNPGSTTYPRPGTSTTYPRPGTSSTTYPRPGTATSTNGRPINMNPARPAPTNLRPGGIPSPPPARTIDREQTYAGAQLRIGRQTDAYFNIERIKLTRSATLVTFSIESISNKNFPIDLAKPGADKAFLITDVAFTKTFPLKNIMGLQGWPKEPYILRPGEKKFFTAEFPRLDDDLFTFHLLEGTKTRQESWDFFNVEIKP